MLNIGIIGAGNIGRVHAESYGRQPDCRVIAIADVDRERATRLAAQVGARAAADAQTLLADPEVQAVSICLPHAFHADAVIAAAAHRKHVLCEKPVATSLDDADRMIAACHQAGVWLMIGHTHRFYPTHRRSKELLDQGAIGRLLFANDVIWSGRDDDAGLDWRGSVAMNGGGIFMDNGIHAADRLRWWIGSDAAWVSARAGRGRGLIEGEEHGTALLGFANGVTAVLQEVLGTPVSAGCCYVELVGTDGVLHVETWGKVRLSKRGQPWEEVSVPKEWPSGFDAEIAEFLAAIRENRPPAVTGEDGRAALAIIQAIYQAVETERAIHIGR